MFFFCFFVIHLVFVHVVGKQSPRNQTFPNSAAGVEASLSSLSLSPHRRPIQSKDASELAAHQSDREIEASALLLAAGDTVDGGGGFQIDRYINDSSEYDDSSEIDVSVGLKTISSDICHSYQSADPSAGGDLRRSSWLSESASSLVDIGVPPVERVASGGSLVSADAQIPKDGSSNESKPLPFDAVSESCGAIDPGVWPNGVDAAPRLQISVSGSSSRTVDVGAPARPALVVSEDKVHDVLVKPIPQRNDTSCQDDASGQSVIDNCSQRTITSRSGAVSTNSASVSVLDGSKVICLMLCQPVFLILNI